MRTKFMLTAVLGLSSASGAMAAETVTYSYDALGRVTVVQHSGSVNNGRQTTYAYDPADNRTSVGTQ